jgi:ubiquitin-protein ligase
MKENLYLAHKINEESLREHQLLIEYNSLKQYCPSGVYVLPQLNNINVWQGVIFIRQGYYKGGVFKFKIEIPTEYPNIGPSIFFHDFVFHPLIHPDTGELALGPQFPSWRPGKDFIFSLLGYLKNIFYSRDMWTMAQYVLNPQALCSAIEDEVLFSAEAQRAALETLSRQDCPKNGGIWFRQFNAVHDLVFQNIKNKLEDPKEFMKYFRENFI